MPAVDNGQNETGIHNFGSPTQPGCRSGVGTGVLSMGSGSVRSHRIPFTVRRRTIHCELRYETVLQLRALGHFESWFLHDTGDELDSWTNGLGCQEFWMIVRSFHPQELRVYQEQV
ncbi:hypothetical protein [Streptomyces sp. TLI_185]|uniref:hypothetical protein n=1 Tax=Streptomyces sp. TLI_185 TaxID=2485151 RepID=UPI000F929224|nr:hypothetical protein [Streptomyces sp. TLI_185]RPF30482.1 hypothetical protein EDD92_0259 [Streptomyces sp. TLI_185]